MQSLRRSLPRRRRHEFHRSLFDVASIKWVRDRAIDHAVEKEGNLQPLLNLKNLLKFEPSKSLPLPLIAQHRESLGIASRPVDFIRRYPSVFQEFFPGGIGIHPHVKLTPEILLLDAEEHFIYQSDDNKRAGADRLLKLLMLARINKFPLHIVERLKWDLGLPHDFTQTLVPEFPDYFQVTGGNGNRSDPHLELVCWSDKLAVSVMEKKACKKGTPIAFPLQYSRGFEVDKKFKKWVDEWQKLPYVSPYENALHLPAKSDEADKWAVSVLHELLHLLIAKKTDRENVLLLGECLGLRARFKRALLQHPGIFYLSSKIGTHTVILREGYKRNLLIENHPLMDMRGKYIHLMNTIKEDKKTKGLQSKNTQQPKLAHSSKGEGEEMQDGETEKGRDGESYDFSDSEVEEGSDDDYSDADRSQMVSQVNARGDRVKTRRTLKYEAKRPLRSPNSLEGRNPRKTRNKEPTEVSRNTVMHGRRKIRGQSPGRLEFSRDRGRPNLDTKASVLK
ncbi:protein WHAT'S THIS FACTOR 9, mitochondrial [Rhododendron vialii]|uniref:protein WHAT'S THIS FACTOR 9, mitochondrial n=1 Tax=Rhododendron vialii TaxID=182163 RepID=UPI00265E354E|nr:protein WHAT'S THIS FACTOR 9, mitochondrial [Rhododendron vialii]XP_058218662.1 protein WHAT'S THIS FACTOR 9, mitochondrial [Rhododendron vialii]XP_058218663.1 protein WHAT'S THIS FACTOR 9, mitochondrial [Rhododendron vialii]XP_058218664.1 protein WHAT'S THIS FACTOR 9, mitochondrial [Rhododendron vialii]